MMDRKHTCAAFWATVLVVIAVVAYPLTFGPVPGRNNGIGENGSSPPVDMRQTDRVQQMADVRRCGDSRAQAVVESHLHLLSVFRNAFAEVNDARAPGDG